MSNNICGNCENFKPTKGDRFFNCASAKHAGVSYGMQVRADTRACDAFLPYRPPSTTMPPPIQKPAAKSARKQPDDRRRPIPWGRVILIAALVIVILIIAGLAYMCASNSMSSPAATPTPKPTSTLPPALPGGPTPTPPPAYSIQYFDMQEWAITPTTMVLISSASRMHQYDRAYGVKETAPPGMDFILVQVTVMNRIASYSISVPASKFVLVDSTGYIYAPMVTRLPYYIITPYEGTSIAPTKSASGTLLYVVPNVILDLEISYLLDPYSVPPVIARWEIP